jgi:hypothetical protein
MNDSEYQKHLMLLSIMINEEMSIILNNNICNFMYLYYYVLFIILFEYAFVQLSNLFI